jgi:hypothetical protein
METTNNYLMKLLQKVGKIYTPITTPKLEYPYDFGELVWHQSGQHCATVGIG